MKVKDLLKKYRMCSNSTVVVQHHTIGDLIELSSSQLRKLEPDQIMNMTANGFDIIDNIFTIHVS